MVEDILKIASAGSAFNFLPLGIFFVLLVTIIAAIDFYFKSKESYKLAIQIPGPTPIPIFGNALLALGKSGNQIVEELFRYQKVYGSMGRGFLGYKPIVFICDPRDIEIILSSNVHLTKSYEYRYFKPWLGDGLLISNGDKWRSHRKLIAPTFHQFVLKSFVGAFNRNSWQLVKRMQKEVGREFDVHDYMSEVTVDILLETAMGHPKTHNDREGFDYAMAVMKLCDIIQKRQITFYLRTDKIFNWLSIKKTHDSLINTIHSLTKKVIRNKKEKLRENAEKGKILKPIYSELLTKKEDDTEITENGHRNHSKTKIVDDTEEQPGVNGEKNRLAFLDLLIESTYCGVDISDEEIKEEVDTIMFEGHDTTAAAASFVLCILACHPDIQEQVFNEQKQIIGDERRAATFHDTLQMNYLERVILETLRLYPPVPVIAREVQENVKCVSQPVTIPKGSTVIIASLGVHRREDIYENPLQFNPDNFLPERTKNRNFYGFIPFSAGPRSCVGRKYAMLKLKILLSTICRNYKISSSCKEKDFILQGDIILKRTDGFRIGIEPR